MYDPRVELEPTILMQDWVWVVVAIVLAAAAYLARRRPDYGVALILAALPLYQVRGNIGVPTTFLELLLGAVILGCLSRYRQLTWQRTPYDWWLALWLGGGLLAALLGPSLRDGLGLWRAFFLEPVVFFYLATAVFRRYSPRAILLGAIGCVAVLVVWTGYLLGFGHAISYDQRLLGPFQSPNYLMLLTLPMALLIAWWPKRELVIARVLTVLAATALFIGANSRGAAIAAGVSLVIGWLFTRGRLRRRLLVVGAASVLLLTAVFGPRLLEHREAQVISARPVIWRESLAILREHPLLGSGPAAFQADFTARVAGNQTETLYVVPQALNPHNLFLVTWTEWGLAALLGLVGSIVAAVLTMIRRRSYWQVVPATMLTAVLIHGQVDTSVVKNDLAVVFMLILVLTTVLPLTASRRFG